MKQEERNARGQMLRERMAYLTFGLHLKCKEAADRLGINVKTAEYHLMKAVEQIRGKKSPESSRVWT